MEKKDLVILTNIIGGVESGRQIYGNRDYGAYVGKGAGSAEEKTCTLGWAQNYGNEGRELLRMILKKDPVAFRKNDKAGIEKKLDMDWEKTGWDPNSVEKKSLVNIILTDAGRECQDELFMKLMETYISSAEAYGVKDVKAQMMWCEIEHLGGPNPVKRIFGRAKKPYTTKTIFASLLLDQNDASSNNQVGDKKFQTRHECCVKWIDQYVNAEGGTEMATVTSIRKKALKWMKDTAADQSHGYSQQNRWGPDYDCSSAVITAWQLAGVPVKTAGASYTGDMKKPFLNNGFEDVTAQVDLSTGEGLKESDVLLNEYGKGTKGNGHTAMYAGNGKIVHARGQSYGSSATGDQGTEIAITPYNNHPWDCVLRYTGKKTASSSIQTAISTIKADTMKYTVGTCSVTLNQFLVGAVDPQIAAIQLKLNYLGYKGRDGRDLEVDCELGDNTAYALANFQKDKGMKNINFGTVAATTWRLLLNAKIAE